MFSLFFYISTDSQKGRLIDFFKLFFYLLNYATAVYSQAFLLGCELSFCIEDTNNIRMGEIYRRYLLVIHCQHSGKLAGLFFIRTQKYPLVIIHMALLGKLLEVFWSIYLRIYTYQDILYLLFVRSF